MCRGRNKLSSALIGLVVTVIAVAIAALGRGDNKDEFRPLFNEKDLEGWEATKPELWTVNDGMIMGKQDRGRLKKNTFLATKEEYSDFVLKASVRLVKDEGNSGIQFRTVSKRTARRGVTRRTSPRVSGACFWRRAVPTASSSSGPLPEAAKKVKPDDWNDYVITAKGHHITLELNGVKSVDLEDPKGDLTGVIGAPAPRRNGNGGAVQGHQDQGTEIVEADELRRLAIRQLADYDARTPGQLFSQPVHLTGTQAYALQTEVVPCANSAARRSSATRSAARAKSSSDSWASTSQSSAACSRASASGPEPACLLPLMQTWPSRESSLSASPGTCPAQTSLRRNVWAPSQPYFR